MNRRSTLREDEERIQRSMAKALEILSDPRMSDRSMSWDSDTMIESIKVPNFEFTIDVGDYITLAFNKSREHFLEKPGKPKELEETAKAMAKYVVLHAVELITDELERISRIMDAVYAQQTEAEET